MGTSTRGSKCCCHAKSAGRASLASCPPRPGLRVSLLPAYRSHGEEIRIPGPRNHMKRRTIVAYPILAVALSATAACTRPAADAQLTAPPNQTNAQLTAPPSQTNAVVAPSSPVAPAPSSSVLGAASAETTPAERPMSLDPALLALRNELLETDAKNPLRTAHFRPLCDKDGYPLVGNEIGRAHV